jgi:NAD-dependent SIR2 family protein deacetylase
MPRSNVREARRRFLTLTCSTCKGPVPMREQRRPVIRCYSCKQIAARERNQKRNT